MIYKKNKEKRQKMIYQNLNRKIKEIEAKKQGKNKTKQNQTK